MSSVSRRRSSQRHSLISRSNENLDGDDVGSVVLVTDFASIGTGVLPARISPAFVAWCPTIDMVALSYASQGKSDGDEENIKTEGIESNTEHSGLAFYRLSGQQVWASVPTQKKGATVLNPVAISWNETGRMFVVALREGGCKVYSSNTGKLMFTVHHKNKYLSVAWSTFRFSEDILAASPFKKLVSAPTNPFRHLPKLSLSPIVTSGGSGQQQQQQRPYDAMYATRSVLEEIIHSKQDTDNFEMSIIFSGDMAGDLSISLFGTFNIGSVQLSTDAEITTIAPFPGMPQESVVLTKRKDGLQILYSISLNFFKRYGLYLCDVTLIPTQICALLEYLRSEIYTVQGEIKAMVNVHTIFYKELIAVAPTPSMALFELVMPVLIDSLVTGVPAKEIVPWMTQSVKEKGIKRWRKDCLHGYEAVRRRLFVHVLPSCERLILLYSHIRGVARWEERGEMLNLDATLLDQAVEQVSSMMREINNFMWDMNAEFVLFRSYANWIDILYEQVTKMPLKENPGEGPRVAQTVKVAEYINIHLPVIEEVPPFGQLAADNSKGLEGMFEGLCETTTQVFEKVKVAMRNQIRVCPVQVLGGTVVCVRSVLELSKNENEASQQWCYIAVQYESRPCEVTMIRTQIGGDKMEASRVDVSLEGMVQRVQQVEFIDDDDVMVLVVTGDENDDAASRATMVSFSYRDLLYTEVDGKDLEKKNGAEGVDLVPMEIKRSREFPRVDDGEESGLSGGLGIAESKVFNEFEEAEDEGKRAQMVERGFVPTRFAVNGAPGRRVGFSLERDQRRYIFFDIDGEEYEEIDEEMEDDKENGIP